MMRLIARKLAVAFAGAVIVCLSIFAVSGVVNAGSDPSIKDWGSPPGSPPPWHTDDIYVDNDGDGIVDEPGEPSKGMKNRLFAMIRNLGSSPANNVTVKIGYAPYGMGYPHTHFKDIAAISGVSLSSAGSSGDEKIIEVEWDLTDLNENNGGLWPYPVGSFDHFCVRCTLEYSGDTDVNNNGAQNNFCNVQTVFGGFYSMNFIAANAGGSDSEAALIVSRMPKDWNLRFEGVDNPDDFVLNAGELRMITLMIAPPEETNFEEMKQNVDISLRLKNKIVGGISFVATAKRNNEPQPHFSFPPSGGILSPYLIGTYDLRRGNTFLHIVNPTAKHLRLYIAFFDDDEKLVKKIWEELTPNDIVEIDVRRASPGAKFGVVKIVSFNTEEKVPEVGIVGYQRHIFDKGGTSESNLSPIPAEILKDDLRFIFGYHEKARK